MDMLRLALERTDSPEGAVEEMIRLLHDIGQGGVCGYKDRRMAYHNSFIIAGKGRAWVLETAGPFWAAKQVKGFHAISNALSIGTDFDRIHPDVLETARKKNWLRSGEEPDFAGIFSDTLYTRFSAARRRQERALEHIQACLHKRESEERAAGGRSGFSVKDAFSLLRDHGGDAGYRPDKDFLGKTLCAHGANAVTRKATQTTASMVAHLQEHEETYWCTAGSAPCLSTFKPVWFQGEVLPDLGEENREGYQYDSTWWQHERLHRAVLRDYRSRFDYFRPHRDELERGFFENVYLRPQSAGIAFKDKFSITLHAFKECESAERTWREAIEGMEIRRKARFLYRCFWRKRNKEADIPV
jgi:dipeptidase